MRKIPLTSYPESEQFVPGVACHQVMIWKELSERVFSLPNQSRFSENRERKSDCEKTLSGLSFNRRSFSFKTDGGFCSVFLATKAMSYTRGLSRRIPRKVMPRTFAISPEAVSYSKTCSPVQFVKPCNPSPVTNASGEEIEETAPFLSILTTKTTDPLIVMPDLLENCSRVYLTRRVPSSSHTVLVRTVPQYELSDCWFVCFVMERHSFLVVS